MCSLEDEKAYACTKNIHDWVHESNSSGGNDKIQELK